MKSCFNDISQTSFYSLNGIEASRISRRRIAQFRSLKVYRYCIPLVNQGNTLVECSPVLRLKLLSNIFALQSRFHAPDSRFSNIQLEYATKH